MAIITSEIKPSFHEIAQSDYKRIRDASLDFKSIPAGKRIYKIHSYPAMFHPNLVRKLISEYSKEDEYILDP